MLWRSEYMHRSLWTIPVFRWFINHIHPCYDVHWLEQKLHWDEVIVRFSHCCSPSTKNIAWHRVGVQRNSCWIKVIPNAWAHSPNYLEQGAKNLIQRGCLCAKFRRTRVTSQPWPQGTQGILKGTIHVQIWVIMGQVCFVLFCCLTLKSFPPPPPRQKRMVSFKVSF